MSLRQTQASAGVAALAWLLLPAFLGCCGCVPGPAEAPSSDAAPAGPARAGEQAAPDSAPGGSRTEFFADRGRAFKALLADPREAQVKLGFLRADDGHSYYDLAFGGDVGLLHSAFAAEQDFSLTVRGLIAARFHFFSRSFDLLNTDFIGGLAAGYRRGEFSAELFLHHQSSHLGDEVLESGERERIDFSRETLRLMGSWERGPLRLYGGPALVVRSDPETAESDLILQAGTEYRQTVMGVPCYAAVDLQSKEENDWAANVAVQVGVELGDPQSVLKRQRLFLEYFNGHSSMGQYHEEHEAYVLLGIGFNF